MNDDLGEPEFDLDAPPVELVAVDADNAPTRRQRIAKSAAQGGAAAAVVVIASWAARLAGVDLDPGPGEDIPVEVAASAQLLLTWLAAARMNRPDSSA